MHTYICDISRQLKLSDISIDVSDRLIRESNLLIVGRGRKVKRQSRSAGDR